jgi:hypothetical protein
VAALRFSGDRDAIRAETVEAALRFLHEALADGNAAG